MLRARHGLILCVISLLVFGVVMVHSAGLTVASDQGIRLDDLVLGKQMVLALLAVLMLALGANIPVQRIAAGTGWRCPLLWIALGCIGLLLVVHVPGIGHEVNGARRWIRIGPVGFQPSEFAKWGMIAVIAGMALRRRETIRSFVRGFLPPMVVIVLVCGLIATEDLGTAVLMGLVGVAMLIASGAKILHALMWLPVGLACFALAVMTSEYRLNRLRAFLDPYQDPEGIGYHVIQSMSAINGGGLAGRGLGNSIQKFGYLPEDTTDFIFAIICEELGIMGAALVVALYAGILLCGLHIVRRSLSPFSRLLGLGVLLTLGFQALINIAVVTGAAPTKGIALPLLSAGGTGWLLTAFSIGLLVSIGRMTELGEMEENTTDKASLEPVRISNATMQLPGDEPYVAGLRPPEPTNA